MPSTSPPLFVSAVFCRITTSLAADRQVSVAGGAASQTQSISSGVQHMLSHACTTIH